jgi:hypothetical protein
VWIYTSTPICIHTYVIKTGRGKLHYYCRLLTVTLGVGEPERAVTIPTSLRGLLLVAPQEYRLASFRIFATRSGKEVTLSADYIFDQLCSFHL